MSDLSIKCLDFTYLNKMLELQEDVIAGLDNPDILRRNTEETLIPCFKKPSLVLGAFYDDKLIAFGILYVAGEDRENLAFSLDNYDDPYTYANIKVVMVKKDFRGNGLQRKFIRIFEEYSRGIGIKTLLSTVSPDNHYSCNNLELCGYTVIKRLKKYGGKDRYIYIKTLQ